MLCGVGRGQLHEGVCQVHKRQEQLSPTQQEEILDGLEIAQRMGGWNIADLHVRFMNYLYLQVRYKI